MAQMNVSQFASELKMPATALLEQLHKAGVSKQEADDTLTEQDKAKLLEYLRKSHGEVEPKALQKVVAQFEEELGHEINYTLLKKEEFLYRRQVTDRFLFSILEGEKIVMIDRVAV